jgi:hypothetical protein
MLVFLRDRASDRKLRLFCCACCRRLWHLLDPLARKVVEAFEQEIDGSAKWSAVVSEAELWEYTRRQCQPGTASHVAIMVNAAHAGAAWAAAWNVVGEARRVVGLASPGDTYEEARAQAAILRDVFGSPLRPAHAVVPPVLAWGGAIAVTLARAAYEDRPPDGTLDTALLGVLADALEDAGCIDTELLGHLRGPGPHMRGCWAVDLLLGRDYAVAQTCSCILPPATLVDERELRSRLNHPQRPCVEGAP